VLAIKDAGHEETSPHAGTPFISRLSCSLREQIQTVHINTETLTYQIYGAQKIKEHYNCNYGLNEVYRKELVKGGLKVAGQDDSENVRIVELPGQRFFIATLFLPQLSSSAENPHPLILGYLKAARDFREIKLKTQGEL